MNLEKEVDFCMPLQNTEDDIIFMFLNLFSYAFATKIVIEEIRHLIFLERTVIATLPNGPKSLFSSKTRRVH